MNKELIKFIELCLAEGDITDTERDAIFGKADMLGVPESECEIILEGMLAKSNKIDESEKELGGVKVDNNADNNQKYEQSGCANDFIGAVGGFVLGGIILGLAFVFDDEMIIIYGTIGASILSYRRL